MKTYVRQLWSHERMVGLPITTSSAFARVKATLNLWNKILIDFIKLQLNLHIDTNPVCFTGADVPHFYWWR